MEPNNPSGDFSQKVLGFFKNISSSPILLLKVSLAVVVALVVFAFAVQMIRSSFGAIMGNLDLRDGGMMGYAIAPSAPPMKGYGGGVAYDMAGPDYDYASEEIAYSTRGSMPSLSARNVAQTMPYPMPGGVPGDNAEVFEVTQYNANIETRRIEETCGTIAGLKARVDVIFENANTGDDNCNFTFKVKHASVEEILAFIKKLDPKDLSENTNTIKREIDDYTNEVDVLTKKRASIDETLKSAIDAYNDVTTLATRSQNADALASIINSKINLIERMTQERININEQLDRLARAKADQLDRLDYTYFYVNVWENKFIDGEQLADSWKQAVREFVWNVNRVVQDLTLNLVLLFAFIFQWILYAVIALVIAKYGWKFAKSFWFR